VAEGTVSWFDPRRGTGVILADTGDEIAVRAAHIAGGGRQSLTAGDRVVFTVFDGPHGAGAADVYVP
jgi:CspA family cold shock protein